MEIAGPDLLQLLSYDPHSGALTWRERSARMFSAGTYSAERKARSWNAKNSGRPALNALHSDGYRHGSIYGKLFMAHRVIWAMAFDSWPEQIDHINGDRSDNRLKNLRAADAALNARNAKVRSDNRSGVPGVHWCKSHGKWAARIGGGKRRTHLGYFQSLDEAVLARRSAEVEYGYHGNHGRSA